MTAIFDQPITEPAAWMPADLEQNRRWEIALAPEEVEDLLDASAKVKADGLPLERITTANFPPAPLPAHNRPHPRGTALRPRHRPAARLPGRGT